MLLLLGVGCLEPTYRVARTQGTRDRLCIQPDVAPTKESCYEPNREKGTSDRLGILNP